MQMAVHTLLHENEYLCSCGERLLFDLYQPLRSISILYYFYIVLVFLKVFLRILTQGHQRFSAWTGLAIFSGRGMDCPSLLICCRARPSKHWVIGSCYVVR